MNKYLGFDSIDFILDTDFRRWVLTPTPESNDFWHRLIQENPEEAYKIEKAREIVKALKIKHQPISDIEIQNRIRQTASHFKVAEAQVFSLVPWYQKSWVRVAATVLLVIGIGWGLYKSSYYNPGPETYLNLVATAKEPLTEEVNNTKQRRQIKLSDGSMVTLQPNSRISFQKNRVSSNRKVFLEGEAFFEVTKDPGRPFLVYANGLVTKVLGTSFKIQAYEKDKVVEVDVKTGRVAVFESTSANIKDKESSKKLEGIVLTPNQQIIYSREEGKMIKSLVNEPTMIVAAKKVPNLVFEEAPASEVFNSLEKYYQVEVLFDEEVLRNCPLTASLTNQSFHEKLTLICKAIEARYEVIDGKVVIYSKGCDN